jgi:hypothetical protein
MRDIHRAQRLFLSTWMTAALGVNNRVIETLGITVKLKIISEAASFITTSWCSRYIVEAVYEDSELHIFSHAMDG